jgi:phage terminase large subunit
MKLQLNVTPVFEKNWSAINAKDENGNRKYRYIINTGSSRSSKTFSLIDCIDLYNRTNRNKRSTVWRDTKIDTKKTVMNDALLHFKSTGRYNADKFNKTESIFNYPTGSTFEIHGTDDENTVHGLNQNVAWLNEPYKISRTIFDQIDQRTTDFILIDWNPLKSHWVDDISKDKRAIVINSTFNDNPFCPPEQRNKILSYQPVKLSDIVLQKLLTEGEAKEYDLIKNELNFSKKQIDELSRCKENEHKRSASEFNWSVYGLGLKAERPNRIFHWEEISLDEYQKLSVPVYYGCDWGSTDPWAIGEAKYYDGCLYIRELNYDSENIIRQRLTTSERAAIDGQDEGIVSWMFSKLGIDREKTIVCDPNRVTKIRALRTAGWDYAIAANKPAGSIIDGIDLLNNMKVYFTSDSENIRYEQENYSRKVDRYGVVLEEPEDVDNHHIDQVRYVALFLQSQGIIRKV